MQEDGTQAKLPSDANLYLRVSMQGSACFSKAARNRQAGQAA